jgi:hypothetical protein
VDQKDSKCNKLYNCNGGYKGVGGKTVFAPYKSTREDFQS